MTSPIDSAATETPLPARRSLFRWLTYALGAAAGAAAGLPLLGYALGQRKRQTEWVRFGHTSEFSLGETRLVPFVNPLHSPWDGVTGRSEVFVRYQGIDSAGQEQFLVFAVNCAHLGCPVSWFPQSGLFMCPCHGGVYDADGERASGPPPRGLFHCRWRVRSGRLEIAAPHYPTLHDTLVHHG